MSEYYEPGYRGDSYDEDRPELPSGVCSACGNECTAVVIDRGIGAYEYWGARGVHHDYVQASPCCEAEVVDAVEVCPDE